MAVTTKYKIFQGSPESLTSLNRISNEDLPLIQRLNIDTKFIPNQNRIDVFFYSLDGRLLSSIVDSPNYTVLAGGTKQDGNIEDITLDPEKDVIQAGYKNGDVNVLYNFINNLYSDTKVRPFFYVESISPDRTEIRALTNDLNTEDIVEFTEQVKEKLNTSNYFEDFRLNFNSNRLPIAINIETTPYRESQAVLIKLYEPLPSNFTVKSQFTIEELVGDSVLYEVITEVSQTDLDTTTKLRGPNYDIEITEENNNPTGFLSYDDLFSYPVSNSFYEVYSLFNEKSSQISLDHTDFNEFINFSSAEERLRNFYYKASLLENYRNQINARDSYTGSLVENIEGIVNNFDHYDRFLYYESGSFAWPKNSSSRPYTLFSTGSTEVINWYSNILLSASEFDSQNKDRLINAIPSFIREDSTNEPYTLFVDMIGQHFDNLWVYMKAVTDKYDADNRLEYGISKDLVREAIENFGIKLYNNNEALENLFAAFTGETYNTGSESTVNSLIVAVEGSGSLSGSAGNEHLQPMPKSSYQKEVYKRIYHNIPLLLKSKGTERGLRALINSFGIPSDTLQIKTFGGADNNTSPFYGPNAEFTSSLDKIRVDNTDTVLTGSTLSNFTTVTQPGKDYSTDLHTVEVGFSPSDSLNSFIKAHPSMSSFDLDEYIGDPSLAYSSSYQNLESLAETVFTSGSNYVEVFDAFEFVRIIKFFDNSIFRIIKDFLPGRSNVDTGVIIKPHILDRSKVKQPQVGWSNQTSTAFTHDNTTLDYTGSYYSTNFSVDGEIETAFVTGSAGLGIIDSASYSYTETYANPSGGYQTLTRNNQDEAAYTGELSGSIIQASNGDLTSGNTFRKLEPEEFSFKYIPRNDFSTPATALEGYRKTVSLNNIIESTSESPSQAGEGSEPLILSIPSYAGSHGYNKVQFNLNGGPIDGTPAADSGSIKWENDEEMDPQDTLLIDFTVDFKDISGLVEEGGELTTINLSILSGSNQSDDSNHVKVATASITRGDLGPSQQSITLEYTHTGSASLIGENNHYFWRADYSSKYDTDFLLSNKVDAEISLNPILTYYDSDAITVWVSETIENDYTSSRVEALAVPNNSSTNGLLTSYTKQAKEVIFEYDSFQGTNNFNTSELTSSVEGGSYRTSTVITDNDIKNTHITSAPYSASFTQLLPQLIDGDTLEFNFTVDFDSYWADYLNTYNFSNTPYITASIRNRNTGIVTGSLSFSIQQGQYPNEYRRTLNYLNNTGTSLDDLEFYYQLNIPKVDKGAGDPQVNLQNVSINYKTPQTVFLQDEVISYKNIGNNLTFLQLKNKPEIASGSLEYLVKTSEQYSVGFIPGEETLFKFNTYASTSNNVDSLRRSSTRLKVDEKTYSPTQGTYEGFFLPGNYSVLSSSIANGTDGLDEDFFAEVQDSNYYSTGWRNGRFEGAKTTNGGQTGNEPSLSFMNFKGIVFENDTPSSNILSIYSGSKKDEEGKNIFYNTYSGLVYALTSATATTSDTPPGGPTINSTSDTSFSFSLGTNGIQSVTYSGSLIPTPNTTSNIAVEFDVTFGDYFGQVPTLTISLLDGASVFSSDTVNLTPGYEAETGRTKELVNLQAILISDSTITDPVLQFTFGNMTNSYGLDIITTTIKSIQDVELFPINNSETTIVKLEQTGSLQTFLYEEQEPTPSSPAGFVKLVESKVYKLDSQQVFSTDSRGRVTNIE